MSTLHLTALKLGLDALLATGTLKAYFMDTSFTPNSETDQYYDDIAASIASGTSGMTLAGVVTRVDAANGRVELDTNNFTQSSISTTTNQYCLVVDTGDGATSPVLATLDIDEGSITVISGSITITVNGEGHYGINAT
jgi:hypothetical protein